MISIFTNFAGKITKDKTFLIKKTKTKGKKRRYKTRRYEATSICCKHLELVPVCIMHFRFAFPICNVFFDINFFLKIVFKVVKIWFFLSTFAFEYKIFSQNNYAVNWYLMLFYI